MQADCMKLFCPILCITVSLCACTPTEGTYESKAFVASSLVEDAFRAAGLAIDVDDDGAVSVNGLPLDELEPVHLEEFYNDEQSLKDAVFTLAEELETVPSTGGTQQGDLGRTRFYVRDRVSRRRVGDFVDSFNTDTATSHWKLSWPETNSSLAASADRYWFRVHTFSIRDLPSMSSGPTRAECLLSTPVRFGQVAGNYGALFSVSLPVSKTLDAQGLLCPDWLYPNSFFSTHASSSQDEFPEIRVHQAVLFAARGGTKPPLLDANYGSSAPIAGSGAGHEGHRHAGGGGMSFLTRLFQKKAKPKFNEWRNNLEPVAIRYFVENCEPKPDDDLDTRGFMLRDLLASDSNSQFRQVDTSFVMPNPKETEFSLHGERLKFEYATCTGSAKDQAKAWLKEVRGEMGLPPDGLERFFNRLPDVARTELTAWWRSVGGAGGVAGAGLTGVASIARRLLQPTGVPWATAGVVAVSLLATFSVNYLVDVVSNDRRVVKVF